VNYPAYHADYESFERMMVETGILPRVTTKRTRTFSCTKCGKKIPPGKPNRRCKECRLPWRPGLDEQAQGRLARRPLVPEHSEKLRQMGMTNLTMPDLVTFKDDKLTLREGDQ